MQKIKFDFEATKERIYAPNSNVPIGAPVDRNGNIANDGNAYGIVLCKETENEKYWVKYNLVVMVGGYCDIIDAQEIWGDEYSAEAIAAMSDITFCDNHELPTGGGGGWPADLPKPSVGGYGYTDEDEIVHTIDEKYLPASGGGAMVVVPCSLNPQTMDAELTDAGVAVMDKINTDYQNGNIYPAICKLSIEIGGSSIDTYINLSGWTVLDGSVGLSFASNDVDRGNFKSQIVKIAKVSGEWVVQILTASIPLGS